MKKPRAKKLNDLLLSRKPGPHKDKRKKADKKRIEEELNEQKDRQ